MHGNIPASQARLCVFCLAPGLTLLKWPECRLSSAIMVLATFSATSPWVHRAKEAALAGCRSPRSTHSAERVPGTLPQPMPHRHALHVPSHIWQTLLFGLGWAAQILAREFAYLATCVSCAYSKPRACAFGALPSEPVCARPPPGSIDDLLSTGATQRLGAATAQRIQCAQSAFRRRPRTARAPPASAPATTTSDNLPNPADDYESARVLPQFRSCSLRWAELQNPPQWFWLGWRTSRLLNEGAT